MPPLDYPGSKLRLYLIRELHKAVNPDLIGDGWVRGTFLGIYRDHTPEAALLTAQHDHQKSFEIGPVICYDLSAELRLVSYEASAAVWLVMYPDGHQERGCLHLGSRIITAAQRPIRMDDAA